MAKQTQRSIVRDAVARRCGVGRLPALAQAPWRSSAPSSTARPAVQPRPSLHVARPRPTRAIRSRLRDRSPSVVFITTAQCVIDLEAASHGVPQGTGSGFIWDEQGHVVTNFHVVAARRRRASRSTTAQLPGDARRRGPEHDIAVLRIDAPASLPAPLPSAAAPTCGSGRRCSRSATRSASITR